ncbi:SH3 domain-containing protein [Primorskyibacter sp. S187A]|uniref:SH3 domain-containing protein n=1 Tax=Primorskyibacter sp. S187A TaxID=3415130 RepID=UPI003C7B496A
MIRWMTQLVTAFALVCPAVAQAQEDMRSAPVRFAPGANAADITARITGRQSVLYTIGAEAGQELQARLTASNTATYFNLYAPGTGPGDQALLNSQFTGRGMPEINSAEITLALSGTYTIHVYQMRNAARRGDVSDYTLSVSVTGALGEVVQGDVADGLQGGPDFWQVATRNGGPLNLRAEPSTGAKVVTVLEQGRSLRNLGCRMAEARRWCRVATLADPGFEGWAAGDFLVEGAP